MSDIEFARRDFRAMGTSCSVLVYAQAGLADALADLARRRVELLESAWSRFRGDSELSRLNARAGAGPTIVSSDTLALVEAMRSAWTATGGAFDPTVLAAIRAQGYDRDFCEVIADESLDIVATPAPGMADVRIDKQTVSLPAGVGLDPGAIGKGLAADIVVGELVGAGAYGVLVDLGGDMAFAGTPGGDEEWRIGIVDERSRKASPTEASGERVITYPADLEHAGVATSTSLTRRWADARHHVIDPVTGSSTDEHLVQVTVTGPRAWLCEVWATAVLVRPSLVRSVPDEMTCTTWKATRTTEGNTPVGSFEKKVA